MKERDATEASLTAEEKLALDADRDLRTVFVYQLSVKASEDDVFSLMSQAGKVRRSHPQCFHMIIIIMIIIIIIIIIIIDLACRLAGPRRSAHH